MNRLVKCQARFLLAAKHQIYPQRDMCDPELNLCFTHIHFSSQNGYLLSDKGNTDSRSKSSKMVTIKDKIEQHDLMAKVNNIRKWLAKGHTVRATITNLSKDEKKVEQLYNDLMKELAQHGKFQMYKTSSRETKFSIEPKTITKNDPLVNLNLEKKEE
ncbi:hypothetical protein GHT06_017533 [Daphnia sinensis]|uniref:Uncharacterized protein n=1 Tax=Daphnia sinensis TaxID=1820382 RepID=A0AAD5KPZ7_9CRUS|nr:hypothetical protein GHT06_017533 [Daphnia sinensis]